MVAGCGAKIAKFILFAINFCVWVSIIRNHGYITICFPNIQYYWLFTKCIRILNQSESLLVLGSVGWQYGSCFETIILGYELIEKKVKKTKLGPNLEKWKKKTMSLHVGLSGHGANQLLVFFA